jgi:hypothetical protein
MVRSLQPHPESHSDAVERIEAEVERAGARLTLRFAVVGDMSRVDLPPPGPPERADRLWEHTCLEAFVRASGDPGYFELNLAPSRAWAAYRFSDYRMDMAIVGDVPPPRIETRVGEGRFELEATLDLDRPFGLLAGLPWHVGLAAIVEEHGGRKSYWALVHPPGAPDFHHEDCFALELPPAG